MKEWTAILPRSEADEQAACSSYLHARKRFDIAMRSR